MINSLAKWFKKQVDTLPTIRQAKVDLPPPVSLYHTPEVYQKEAEVAEMKVQLQALLKEKALGPLDLEVLNRITTLMETLLILCEASPVHAQGFLTKTVHAAIDREMYILGVIRPMEVVIRNKHAESKDEAAKGALLIVTLDKLNRLFHQDESFLLEELHLPGDTATLQQYGKALSQLLKTHVDDVIRRLVGFSAASGAHATQG